MRTIFIILFLAVTSVVKANSLDTVPRKGNQHLTHITGMSKKQFDNYRKNMKSFDKRIFDIWKDNTLDKNAKGATIENVMKERRAWLQQHLSVEQIKQLAEFHQKNASSSPHAMERKKMEERLKKKGMTVKSQRDSL